MTRHRAFNFVDNFHAPEAAAYFDVDNGDLEHEQSTLKELRLLKKLIVSPLPSRDQAI